MTSSAAIDPLTGSGSRLAATPESPDFRPIFVVGCQRSGTTALAVMLDRHSRIAMMPETQFFCRFVSVDRRQRLPMSREALIRRALEDFFIKEAKLDFETVLGIYRAYPPTYANLFRSLLEAYARKHGKSRPAEKSCEHLFHVRDLLRLFPGSRIICIVRDGRDVVRSILRTGWNLTAPFPVAAFAQQWNHAVRVGTRLAAELPPDRFTTVRYEDLITRPEHELRRLGAFLGIEYESTQIESGVSSDVVPQYELAWKGKSKEAPDPARVGAWRSCGDPQLIAEMNHYMGRLLRAMGYEETESHKASLLQRMRWQARYVPYRRPIYPLAVRALRTVRQVRRRIASSADA